jgi:hypothetical protein
MSETALCWGVVDQIKEVLTVKSDKWIDVRPTDEPPSAMVADIFIAVRNAGWRFDPINNGVSEQYRTDVTVSIKLAARHVDFWGLAVNDSWDKSLSYAVRQIINAVHLQPDVIRLANLRLNTGMSSPIVEMLQAVQVDDKKARTAKWWQTETTAQSKRVNDTIGYSQTIHFFGGKRVQGIGNYS